ncbi:unnamed protein product [Kuraishia capsulata CBS 1993]|uniref:Uncharacterized protein n=1 Tax=Kuraishia capsulata CBS 1993 TaxID=1382522 RepID=W6MNW3_9ASCO|nr:uncharacterized protein KUCA_T00003943001 [Kuraishia capsulata CBS 1993]CDK27963.1 unnamed protein product [Kuraishia capsulata CBS 1993]
MCGGYLIFTQPTGFSGMSHAPRDIPLNQTPCKKVTTIHLHIKMVQIYYHPLPNSSNSLNRVSKLPLRKIPQRTDYLLSSSALEALQFKNFQKLSNAFSGDSDLNDSSEQITNGTEEAHDKDGDVNMDGQNEEDNDLHLNKETIHFVNVSDFEFQSKKEKLLTISLENIPSSLIRSELLIEAWLDHTLTVEIAKLKPEAVEKLNLGYRWTFVENEYIELRCIFLEFADILTLKLIESALEGWAIGKDDDKEAVAKLKVVLQPGTRSLLEKLEAIVPTDGVEHAESIADIHQSLTAHVARLIKVSRNELKPHAIATIGKLQDLEEQYTNYQIDPKELVDIAPDLLESAERDILDFRLSVLRVEKQKREKQLLSDKRKSRQRVKKLFQDIQRSRSNMDVDQDVSEEEAEDEELETVDDYQYELDAKKQREQRQQRLYQNRLDAVKTRDLTRHKNLLQFENTTEHGRYEGTVVPEKRAQFLKDFVENVVDGKNKIDENLESYYVKHVNYVNFRLSVKAQEGKQDDEDREEERKMLESQSEATDFISTFGEANEASETKEKVKLVLKKKDKEEEEEPKDQPSQSHLPSPIIPKVESKIAAVVEELLGMPEDSLVEFILNYVTRHYYSGKTSPEFAAFLKELEETLDEDASVAMDSIFETVSLELSEMSE